MCGTRGSSCQIGAVSSPLQCPSTFIFTIYLSIYLSRNLPASFSSSSSSSSSFVSSDQTLTSVGSCTILSALQGINPASGPDLGGINITIDATFFDMASELSCQIGSSFVDAGEFTLLHVLCSYLALTDTFLCIFDSISPEIISSTRLTCPLPTSPSSGQITVNVVYTFGHKRYSSNSLSFTFIGK